MTELDELLLYGIGAAAFIAGVFIGALIYAIADGCFYTDLSKPHDDYD